MQRVIETEEIFQCPIEAVVDTVENLYIRVSCLGTTWNTKIIYPSGQELGSGQELMFKRGDLVDVVGRSGIRLIIIPHIN